MAVDHASGVFNAGRLVTDSFVLNRPGAPLDPAQFLTRWITHVCAPTFVFLAGAALALSIEKRHAAGESCVAIDRFIVTRGLFIAGLDPLWMSLVFAPGHVLLQVLYAIGGSLVAMVALRRLPERWLLAAAILFFVGGEALTGLVLSLTGGEPTLLVALLLTGGQLGGLIVAYPLVPWLAFMLLGWCFGRFLVRADAAAAGRLLAVAGVGALALFALVRGLNGYGNMRLPREDASLVQWLHVSKYPPSLSYAALELGLMALGLAALLALQRAAGPHALAPLLVLGQTALFFYLLHVHALTLAGAALGAAHRAGLGATYAAAAAVLAALYPLCARYRRYKLADPDGWNRYV
jgi:uncharacterized membrane protein